MDKKKIVLDTNILISALGWDGKPKEIFRKILNGEFELIISNKQLEELHRVMDYPKFKFTNEQKGKFVSIILEVSKVVETLGRVKIVEKDPDDNMIIESAVIGKAEYIISGDPHLLELREYARVMILTAAEFLERF